MKRRRNNWKKGREETGSNPVWERRMKLEVEKMFEVGGNTSEIADAVRYTRKEREAVSDTFDWTMREWRRDTHETFRQLILTRLSRCNMRFESMGLHLFSLYDPSGYSNWAVMSSGAVPTILFLMRDYPSIHPFLPFKTIWYQNRSWTAREFTPELIIIVSDWERERGRAGN